MIAMERRTQRSPGRGTRTQAGCFNTGKIPIRRMRSKGWTIQKDLVSGKHSSDKRTLRLRKMRQFRPPMLYDREGAARRHEANSVLKPSGLRKQVTKVCWVALMFCNSRFCHNG